MGPNMPLTKEETFHLEEYKALRGELATELKDRLEFHRWGLIAIAALYGYILANPKPILFVVPFVFSLIVCWHLNGEHKNVAGAVPYIRTLESWLGAAVATGGPGGWETHLGPLDERPPRTWWPLPLWYAISTVTFFAAVFVWLPPLPSSH
jgi:hypothetical protein